MVGLTGVLIFSVVGYITARDYFSRWANAPEVRVQYETTMVTALGYLDQVGRRAATVSTITPGPFHSPAVARLVVHNPAVTLRWFDGRESLLLPGDSSGLVVIPGFTPLPAVLEPYLADLSQVDELPMRPDDLDRPVRIYGWDGPATTAAALSSMTSNAATVALPVKFGESIELLGYDLSGQSARAGETITLLTAWRLLQPLPDAMLFVHLAGAQEPLAQADSLGAPGELWVSDDILLQVHELRLPPDLTAGEYPLAVGVYTQDDGRRLATGDGRDWLPLTQLSISHE